MGPEVLHGCMCVSVSVPACTCASPLGTCARIQACSHTVMHMCICTCVHVAWARVCECIDVCAHLPWVKMHFSYDSDPDLPQISVLGEAAAWPLQGVSPAGGSPRKLRRF